MSCTVSRVPQYTKEACWRIEGVSGLRQKLGEFVESPPIIEFEGKDGFSAAVSLRFYWGGFNHEKCKNEEWVSAFVVVKKMGSQNFMWAVKMVLVNQRNNDDDHVWDKFDTPNDSQDGGEMYGAPCLEKRAILIEKGFMVDDAIILKLIVKAWLPKLQTCSTPKLVGSDHGTAAAFAADFAALLERGVGSDVSLKPGIPGSEEAVSESLRAHRSVLAARSPVFERMFFGEATMIEAKAGAEVCLSDMEPEVAKFFLHFLYTGRVNNEVWKDDDTVCHLLSSGHKYEVTSLVETCVAHLVSSLNEENVAERLMLADLLDMKQIREAALEYMCASSKRLSKIQGTQAFKRLGEKRPHLALEILSKMAPPTRQKRKAELDSSLPDDLSSKTVAQLKQLCSDRGLSTSGIKQTLIDRLQNHAGSR